MDSYKYLFILAVFLFAAKGGIANVIFYCYLECLGSYYEQKDWEKLKKKEIDSIHAIWFIVQSSNYRLTLNQKYMFDSIINLFGNDENFIIIITFCDCQVPQLKSALLSPESNLKEIISLIKYPWYLKFNNSAIFASNKDKFNEMF